ncbi:hypothetical protein MUP05_09355 [Candidatus Bathyarchaeota archaeon]|nr:hypothetical protein [Candidatus Bathyarchaeota archaeon]
MNYFPLLTAVVAFVGRPRVAQDDWKLGDFFYLPLKEYAQKGILVSGASGLERPLQRRLSLRNY